MQRDLTIVVECRSRQSRVSEMKLYYLPGASSLFPHIVFLESGLAFLAVKVDLSPYPSILALRKRIGARAAVQEAMRTEKLIP